MNLWQRVRSLLGGEKKLLPPNISMHPDISVQDELENDEPEVVVPEISAEALQAALSEPTPPLVLDVRELHEWRLVRMDGARHIPMNDVPDYLETLPRDCAVVVMCAHGSRSYSVAAWLIEHGIDASSLAGGITQWARRGGSVTQGE